MTYCTICASHYATKQKKDLQEIKVKVSKLVILILSLVSFPLICFDMVTCGPHRSNL